MERAREGPSTSGACGTMLAVVERFRVVEVRLQESEKRGGSRSVRTVGRRVLALPIALVVELRLLRLVGAHAARNGTGGGSWYEEYKQRGEKRAHAAEVEGEGEVGARKEPEPCRADRAAWWPRTGGGQEFACSNEYGTTASRGSFGNPQ